MTPEPKLTSASGAGQQYKHAFPEKATPGLTEGTTPIPPDTHGGQGPESAADNRLVSDVPPGTAPIPDHETQSIERRRRRRAARRGLGQATETDTAGGATAAPLSMGQGFLAPEEEEDEQDVGKRRSGQRRRSGATDETTDVSFMHPSERDVAKLLDFYGVKYLYEPRSFPLRWDGDRVTEMFTPDLYLPEQDQYLELTTMKQSLVTQKNRKLRRLRQLYPDVSVLLLYRRDIMRLLAKHGYGPLAGADVRSIDQVLFSADQIRQRVQELGSQITRDYAGRQIILIGVLRGVVTFMADLMREIGLPLTIDFMEVSQYASSRGDGVTVTRDAPMALGGKSVILVEDIVDTGLTLQFLLQHLSTKGPASVAVCTLLDKQARRVTDVRLDYVGFEVPDEFVVGYGLDYEGMYRNRSDIAVLKPVEPRIESQR